MNRNANVTAKPLVDPTPVSASDVWPSPPLPRRNRRLPARTPDASARTLVRTAPDPVHDADHADVAAAQVQPLS
jgi:hypothetical protein